MGGQKKKLHKITSKAKKMKVCAAPVDYETLKCNLFSLPGTVCYWFV